MFFITSYQPCNACEEVETLDLLIRVKDLCLVIICIYIHIYDNVDKLSHTDILFITSPQPCHVLRGI